MTTDIETYLKEHENKDFLRFITCGSVDDGKSTLIGRLLHDSKMIYEDQLNSLVKDSKKHGTTGEEIDFALLVDGLSSEREQGITIDVAYRFFSTDRKKYIIADTPGHEQYTRNMATGASSADLAVILIDARYGVQTQTKRHSFIVNLLGIKDIVVAVNKMDLVGFKKEVFDAICEDFMGFAKELGFNSVAFIPLSALKGDNIVEKSPNTPWFEGFALLEFLDRFSAKKEILNKPLRLPVQYVNRPNLDFRGFCGTIESGTLSVGDDILILPSRKTTNVKSIFVGTKEVKSAGAYEAITFTTQGEIDISRGDIVCLKESIPAISACIKANIVWMSERALNKGDSFLLKISSNIITATVSSIEYKVDINTLQKEESKTLALNEIGSVIFTLSKEIPFDRYEDIKGTGSFILIDRYENDTLGAGMIEEACVENSIAKSYSDAEKELNSYIRKHYPEWGCREI